MFFFCFFFVLYNSVNPIDISYGMMYNCAKQLYNFRATETQEVGTGPITMFRRLCKFLYISNVIIQVFL